MKIRTLIQVNDRTAGGHMYSAGEGAVSVIDDGDSDMVTLMHKLAAAGQVEILDESEQKSAESEQKSAEDKPAGTKAETKPVPAKKTTGTAKAGE